MTKAKDMMIARIIQLIDVLIQMIVSKYRTIDC